MMRRAKDARRPERVVLRLTQPLGENPTARDFEKYVVAQIESWGYDLESLEVSHLEILSGGDGDYEIDVTVRFRALGGMNFVCLVECKCRKEPVKRSDLQVLLAKVHAVGAHKGVMVSRSGFQSGAINYALAHGIALIMIAGGQATYATMWPYH